MFNPLSPGNMSKVLAPSKGDHSPLQVADMDSAILEETNQQISVNFRIYFYLNSFFRICK
jgi:hypothetical protein